MRSGLQPRSAPAAQGGWRGHPESRAPCKGSSSSSFNAPGKIREGKNIFAAAPCTLRRGFASGARAGRAAGSEPDGCFWGEIGLNSAKTGKRFCSFPDRRKKRREASHQKPSPRAKRRHRDQNGHPSHLTPVGREGRDAGVITKPFPWKQAQFCCFFFSTRPPFYFFLSLPACLQPAGWFSVI